eukprot:Gb_30721 [translate_table: standard]
MASVSHAIIPALACVDLTLLNNSRCSKFNRGFMRQVGSAFRFCVTSHPKIQCAASEKERVVELSKSQKNSTELMAELLKSDNPQRVAQVHVDSLTEEFFSISSTFMEMARKEGNKDMVKRIEYALKVAMDVKGKTLRPEVQLLNQLLRDTSVFERSKTFNSYKQYLSRESYFFQLLSMLSKDVEMMMDSPQKLKLLKQLDCIKKEAEKISKSID